MNDLQIANQQLKTDIEKEQALERQRVDFFSAASHELKTPLTILKGHLAGMLNGVSGYENHIEYMERSLAVVDRMEKLVKELLYVSKAEETQKAEYKTVDFAEILRVQVAAVADLLEEKKQHLEANIPKRKCAVCGKEYWPTHSQQKFCSDECQKVNHNKVSLEFYHKKKEKEKQKCKNLSQTKEQVLSINSSELITTPA